MTALPSSPVPGLDLPPAPDTEPVAVPGDGVELRGYLLLPSARPAPGVLVWHGWGQDAAAMLWAARALRAEGFAALSLSLRGWRGGEGCDDYGLRQPLDAALALAWLAARPEVTGPPALFGYSQGGLVSLLAAQRGARPAGIVALNPPTDLRDFRDRSRSGLVRAYMDAVCADGRWAERSPLLRPERPDVPVLVVVGADDEQVPPDHGARLAASWPGAALEELPGVRHLPDEAGRAEVLRLSLPFLRSLRAGR